MEIEQIKKMKALLEEVEGLQEVVTVLEDALTGSEKKNIEIRYGTRARILFDSTDGKHVLKNRFKKFFQSELDQLKDSLSEKEKELFGNSSTTNK